LKDDAPNLQVVDVTSVEDYGLMEKAREVGECLYKHYPNHLWQVSWQGGALVVKNLAISSHYGFLLPKAANTDHKLLKQQSLLAGGELLERAGMSRGAWNGQGAQQLEGSDERFFKPW
jgi:hypothetical protein